MKDFLEEEDQEYFEREYSIPYEASEEAEDEGRNLQSSDSVDWRQSGAVTGIKNQGSCGGCYSFAAADAMEGAHKIKSGSLVPMSTQQLLDCTNSYGNSGCMGGLMTNCYSYLRTSKIMTAPSYPYTGRQAACRYNPSSGVVSTRGFTNLPRFDFNSLLNAVK